MATATINSSESLRTAILARYYNSTADPIEIAEFRALNLPEIGSGTEGGTYGTDYPYTDYQWFGNVARLTESGWRGHMPTLRIIA